MLTSLAEDHPVSQRHGVVKTRAQWLAELRSGDTSFTTLRVENPQVQVHGATAVVTYVTRLEGKVAGQAVNATSQTMRVFVRRDGRRSQTPACQVIA